MAEITEQEQKLMAAKFADFSEGFRRIALSASDLDKALSDLAEAARKVPFPPLDEVARIRMLLMREKYGVARFLMPSWWQWLWIALRPNAGIKGCREAASP